MRINWIDMDRAKPSLAPLTDRAGAVEGLVVMVSSELKQADGGPSYRECWYDTATDRFVDATAGIAYAHEDVIGWALGWATVAQLEATA